MRLRVGLVGLGDAWEARYRPALRALSDRFDVRAVCADVAARAEQVANEFHAMHVDGYRALSCRSDVDAVLMLSRDWYGPLPILAACEAGKAVYCAAALDIDPSRAQEVTERVERSGVAFMAEFARRQAPATLRLKELIATKLGNPQLLFAHHRLNTDVQAARPRRGAAHSIVTRDLIELVDWCCYVVGRRPTSVFGVQHRPSNQEEDDYQMMSVGFSTPVGAANGPLAHISCGRYLRADWPEAVSFRPPADLQVCCERGVAFIDLPATLIWFDEAGRHRESLDSERPVGEQMLTQFHRAVTSLVRKTTDLEDAYAALQLVQNAQQSCVDGLRVPLDRHGSNSARDATR